MARHGKKGGRHSGIGSVRYIKNAGHHAGVGQSSGRLSSRKGRKGKRK